ncbi:hypothetical protein [Streptomyces sp. JJ36]|uniref:hypothetical protein n=1 Tax=Streptomyces sp. JJ36 TaxID=2736645 RepID=UPI001F366397|nr:hypothetical protein [Streptomyces sp. JJ36]MCF6523139.1 hypothetical protein [Streptomyces sp. JJ36]
MQPPRTLDELLDDARIVPRPAPPGDGPGGGGGYGEQPGGGAAPRPPATPGGSRDRGPAGPPGGPADSRPDGPGRGRFAWPPDRHDRTGDHDRPGAPSGAAPGSPSGDGRRGRPADRPSPRPPGGPRHSRGAGAGPGEKERRDTGGEEWRDAAGKEWREAALRRLEDDAADAVRRAAAHGSTSRGGFPQPAIGRTTRAPWTGRPAAVPRRERAARDLRTLSSWAIRSPHAARHLAGLASTRQIEPDGALVFACLLHLADRDDQAEPLWQFAAGAGKAASAECLYLLHLTRGELRQARHWAHEATALDATDDDTRCPPGGPEGTRRPRASATALPGHPAPGADPAHSADPVADGQAPHAPRGGGSGARDTGHTTASGPDPGPAPDPDRGHASGSGHGLTSASGSGHGHGPGPGSGHSHGPGPGSGPGPSPGTPSASSRPRAPGLGSATAPPPPYREPKPLTSLMLIRAWRALRRADTSAALTVGAFHACAGTLSRALTTAIQSLSTEPGAGWGLLSWPDPALADQLERSLAG